MTLVQHSSSNHWFEVAPDDDALPLRAFLQDDGAGGFTPATSGSQDAAFVDINDTGAYAPIDLTDRAYFVSDGSDGFTVAQAGTEAASLIDDGAGGVMLSTDLTLTPLAALYADGAGNYVLTGKDGADGLRLLLVAANVLPFL